MKNKLFLILLLFVLGACTSREKNNEVVVLCGASMRAPMEKIIKLYSNISNDKILMNYGGSGELCAQIQLSGKGDLL